jgi:hypothetical protein
MASGTSGLRGELAAKLKMNKRTKEGVQMGPAYESTKTGLQYWEAVKTELETRKGVYEKALAKFNEAGGSGSVEDNSINVKLIDVSAVVKLDEENRLSNCMMRIELSTSILMYGSAVENVSEIKKVGKKIGELCALIADEESLKEVHEHTLILTNAIIAMFGLNGSEEAQRMAEELRSYLENDGYIKGMHNMANNHILEDSLLTAMSFIPEETKKEKAQAKG